MTDEQIKVPAPRDKEKKSSNRSAQQLSRVHQFLSDMPSITATDTHYNFSLYGPRGGGKTTAGCGIVRCLDPSRPDVFYVDVENSYVALLNEDNPCYPYLQHIRGPFKPKSFDEFFEVVKALCETEAHTYGAVVIDTVGEIADDTAGEVLQRNIKGTSRNPFLASEHEYRERNERLRRAFKMLRDAPLHVVLISHEASPDPENGRPNYSPQLSGKILSIVENNCDVQIRMGGELKGKEFKGWAEITSGAATNSSVKSRIMGLPNKVRDFRMEHIFAVKKPTRSNNGTA